MTTNIRPGLPLRIADALAARYNGPRGYVLVFAAALAVVLPSLGTGIFLDDYMHMLTLEGMPSPAGRWDLFRFAEGSAAAMQQQLERGPYPWYVLQDVKLHFFRPLTSALMNLDHALFGRAIWLYHAHSILWYMALVGAAALILRRSLGGGVAVLALFIYAVDEGHSIPAIWLANRNALVASTPALLGLAAHLKWREDHWRPGLPLSLLGYGLGILGGETALAVLGYLAAYEAFAARGQVFDRVRALAPAALLVVAYLAVYKLADFGVRGSGVYLDPLGEPADFARRAPLRFLSLLVVQFYSVPAEVSILSASAEWICAAAGLLGGGIMLVLLRRAWSSLQDHERRALRWLLPGAALAALPVLATFPSGRLLVVASLGGSALIAVIIRDAWRRRGEAARLLKVIACLFVALHLVLAPGAWAPIAVGLRFLDHVSLSAAIAAEVDDETVSDTRHIVVYADDPVAAIYTPLQRAWAGRPYPRGWIYLSMTPCDHVLTRTAPDTFELELLGGEILESDVETLFRGRRFPIRKGDIVRIPGIEITVLETGKWGPTRMSFRIDDPGAAEKFRYLAWRDGALRKLALPATGDHVRISRSPGLLDLRYILWHLFGGASAEAGPAARDGAADAAVRLPHFNVDGRA